MAEYIDREELIKALETDYNRAWSSKPRGVEEYVEGARDEYDDVLKIVCDMKAADVQPVDRWIDAQKNPPPIIDRRSMTSESVLILRDNSRCSVAYYCNSAEDGDYWTTDDDKTIYCWEEVTHWQPLPESPKEEK